MSEQDLLKMLQELWI